MKRKITFLSAAFMLLAFLTIPMGMRGQTATLVSGSGTSGYTVPDGWTTSGTVEGGSYLKFADGTMTSPEFAPHDGLSFTYSVATFGSGDNHPLTIRILNASTDEVIVEMTTATPTSSTYINTGSPLSLGDVTVAFKIQMYGPNNKAVRLRNYSVTGNPAGGQQLTPSDLALTDAPVELEFDLYDNADAQTISYTTSSTGEVTVSQSDYITATVNANNTITVTPVAVTNGPQTITVNQAADDTYAAGSVTFTIDIEDSTPSTGSDVTFNATVDQGEGSIVKDGVTFTCDNGVLNNGSEYRLYKNSTTTFSVTSGTITQIVFTCPSSNPASGFGTQTGWTTNGNNGTWTGSAESVSFVASNKQVRATQIVVTVENGGTPAPSIVANNVEIAYDATTGSITYTIENGVDGGTVTAATESESWLTLPETFASPIEFTCTANEAAADRTATVTLTYTYDSQTVTKNVTVTQAGDPNVTPTIAEVRAQGTGSAVTKGFVTSITGSYNKTAYIQDATAAIVVYGNFTAALGDEIRVSGTLQDYNGLLEIINPQVDVLSSENTIEPELMTVAEVVASTNQGWYIRIENAIVDAISDKNVTIVQGDNSIVVRFVSTDDITFEANAVISLSGNIGYYNGNQIANPQNVEVQAAPAEPSITVTTATVNASAEGADGTIEVTYANITEVAAEVWFCDAAGTTDVTYDWIYAEIDADNNVYYVINANEGEARTAYFKVWAYDDELNEVYSDLITVNQAEYVAPALDYATLPFSFDGGRNDIETTDGLTQEGLDSDYNSSPKLKFNSTGDWVILKFNERPGTLTFDIKGNGFSGGTFTVQTSEDGVTYENLDEYTELGNADTKTFDNLGENVRYIKWIYTEKVNGNVALGNITLAKYEAPQPSVTVTPSIINAPAEGADGSLALAYENITEFIGFDFSFCDANGGELEEDPDWIYAEMHGEDSLYYVIGDNTSEDRTAYIKVYTYDDNLEVYAIVTVNQAEYVAPVELEDYAIFTGDLIEGDYLIVYDGHAMNNVVTSDRLQYAEVEAENDVISTDNAAIVWHIAPNDGGYWTIYSADANAYAAGTGAKNKAQMLADGTDAKALWTVTGTETFEFVNKANSEAGVNANLRNNGTYGFACYSTGTGGALTLYKKVTTTADYTLNITGYGDSEKDHYYLFASPVYGLNPANVEGMTDGEFDLYYFDQTQELEWINYETENGINHFYLTPGKGYLYAHKTDTTLTFTGEPYAGNGQIALTYDANAEFAGWNLIGNPFSSPAVLDNMNYYKLNPEGSEVMPELQSSKIDPMEGVFVYAYDVELGEPISTATFNAGIAVSDNDVFAPAKGITLNLTHNTTAVVDRAIVTFGEGSQLPKFQLNAENTKVYFSQGAKDYAIVRSNAKGEMPVNFKAAKNGTYTLSIDTENVEMEYLHLIDNMTGADVDLLRTPSYTFDANTTDFASRFRLVFSANGVDDNTESSNASFAFYNGSEWVISNTGAATLQVVDVMGRVLSTESINGNATANVNQVAGIYMLRLVNGDNVRVQKIVVK